MKLKVVSALVAWLAILSATTVFAQAQDSGATTTVRKFYNWYLAQHGKVYKHFAQVKSLVDPNLYDDIASAYFTTYYSEPAGARRTEKSAEESPGSDSPIKLCTSPTASTNGCSGTYTTFDLWVNASSVSVSYALGSPSVVGNTILVPVEFRFSDPAINTRVTVVLRKSDRAYRVYDLKYKPVRFYYIGPVDDLRTFLGKYNC